MQKKLTGNEPGFRILMEAELEKVCGGYSGLGTFWGFSAGALVGSVSNGISVFGSGGGSSIPWYEALGFYDHVQITESTGYGGNFNHTNCGGFTREADRTDVSREETIAERAQLYFLGTPSNYGDVNFLADGTIEIKGAPFPTADQVRFEGNQSEVESKLWFLSDQHRWSLANVLTDRGVNASFQNIDLLAAHSQYDALGAPNGTSIAAFVDWIAQQFGTHQDGCGDNDASGGN
jgi:hypothetical protein